MAYISVLIDVCGDPVEYREVQGYESSRFLSYFPRFVCLRGGVATGFHHVSTAPPPETKRLYRVTSTGSQLIVREVRPEGHSLVRGDAYVLDLGGSVWQLNTQGSAGKEKYKAAEFLQSLVSDRQGASDVTVFGGSPGYTLLYDLFPCSQSTITDEGTPGVGTFLTELGIDTMLPSQGTQETNPTHPRTLFRLSDASGSIDFEAMDSPSWSSLSSSDAFLLDDSGNSTAPAIYIWIGKEASLSEKRLAVQYAQRYLYQNRERSREHVSVNIVKIKEGHEIPAFLHALGND